ncbi:MAG: hypothetical protein KDI63_17185 [Gammaproteobacteria bacterium]|nr:hypothetical protein [Gammaproteobacteria bacterium]
MIKNSLEKFDSPIIIINQTYDGEDWGVMASYISDKEVHDMAGEEAVFTEVGWHLSVTLPNLDDISFEQVFSTPEVALEFGIEQILSGALSGVKDVGGEVDDGTSQFGKYASFDHLFGTAPRIRTG